MKTLFKKDITHLYIASVEQLNSLSHVGDYHACLLGSEDILRYIDNPIYDLSTAAVGAVDGKKQFFCAAFIGRNLTAYAFFATGEIDAAFNSAGYGYGGAGFRLPEKVLYMYKVFVLPEYRGKNQMAVCVQHAVSSLLPTGGWVVSSTDVGNHAAQGMFKKLGFVRKQKISEYRLLGLGYYNMPRHVQLGGEGDSDSTTIELQKGPLHC